MTRSDEDPLAPKRLYVLVADSAMARFFKAKTPVRSIEEILDHPHREGRQKNSEIYTDRPGSNHGGAGGYQTYDRETDEDPENARFARELGEYLNKARHKGRFDNLILVAPPKFLGVLRNHLSKECLSAVMKTIDKDLVREDAAAITRHLSV
ncbi:host attachment protein [Marinobacter persicus]|uniref:Protein required for attachment to host cells n=1 Tax=Marinobacter persicus TaxID=930118 RepID=A0A2S6G9N4_9GAMM|nr:host attachment protein [Marinobacter persicus]PPK53119.1 protein required for attachment to host cells [Marinobacter persicus]PPK55996.1 protein required for attachment to host cells [Marinobacter persicus]PPK59592.1 protein required for attachment to host cells [Marinobacter persicus]